MTAYQTLDALDELIPEGEALFAYPEFAQLTTLLSDGATSQNFVLQSTAPPARQAAYQWVAMTQAQVETLRGYAEDKDEHLFTQEDGSARSVIVMDFGAERGPGGTWIGRALLVESNAPSPGEAPEVDPDDADFVAATGSTLNPFFEAIYSSPGDPGFGLDSDFMTDMSQVSVSGGIITITADSGVVTPSGRDYASACIGTKDDYSFLYGTIEAEILYPAGQGVWPAFWMIEEGTVATPPEVDIMEAYPAPPGAGGGSGVNVLVVSNHYAGGGGVDYFVHDAGSDLTGAYHKHRLVWAPASLSFYVDDVLIWSTTAHVPNVPMYPIINLAMGATGYRTDGTTPAVCVMQVKNFYVFEA